LCTTGAQLQTFRHPTASKSFLYSTAFMAKSGAQTLTFKSVMDRQTKQEGQHPLTGQRAANFRQLANQ